jgi:hypothetical protein
MFASIRCYVVQRASAGGTLEFARRVDAEFADQIAAQPGFVWYAFLDCGRDVMTISVFRERDQAVGSRELARGWIEERMSDFDLTLTEALDGAIPVSRAAPELLQPAAGWFARVRRYKLGEADLGEFVWRVVDHRIAERIAGLDRFVAYLVFSSGTGELATVSVFQDPSSASASDELGLAFVRYELDDLDLEHTDAIGGGKIVVSRANQALLEPIHP